MHPIIEGIIQAINPILTGDPEVYGIAALSLYVSVVGILLASAWSIPAAIALALRNFHGKRILKGLFNAFIGMDCRTRGQFRLGKRSCS